MQLALGLVGGYLFGPIGYLVGSTIGSLLEKSKTQNPQPIKAQSATYGQMIPIVFGSWRCPAWICWQTDVIPHTSGGKGFGSTPAQTQWTVSLAAKFCKGPAQTIRRIWADSVLIYSTVDGEVTGGDLPMAIYLGVETADPDPTMEAALGVGHVPAFRDDVAIVLTDWDVTSYGGRVPNLNAEVVTHAGAIPWRVSTYSRLAGHTIRSGIVLNDDGTTTNAYLNWEPSETTIPRVVEVRDIDGTLISTTTTTVSTPNTLGIFTASQCENNPHVTEITWSSNSGTDYGNWYYDESRGAHPIADGHDALVVYNRCIFLNNNVYAIGRAIGGAPFIARYPSPIGITSGMSDKVHGLSATSASENYAACVSDDGYIYITDLDKHGRLQKLDADLNVVHDWGTSGPPIDSFNFVVYKGQICWLYIDGGGDKWARLQSINADDTFTDIGMCPVSASGDLISLQNGLVSVQDGIVSLEPPVEPITYGEIVAEISDLCDQPARDVSQLVETVPGYAILQQGSGRDAIAALMPVDFFDPVESGTVVKFVKRGGPPVVTIPDTDLGARSAGEQPVALVTPKRRDELELPKILYFTFADYDAAYQPSTQHEQRQITRSQLALSTQVNIAIKPKDGKRVVATQLYNAWQEQTSFVITVPRKYSYLEPTDTVIAGGKEMRIGSESWATTGVITFECLASHQAIWVGGFVAGSSLGYAPVTPPSSQLSQLLMLDIPLVTDSDVNSDPYAAMAGATSSSWAGATLFKSSDGGANYSSVVSTSIANVIGTTSNALGDFPGGNTVDETNVLRVVVGAGGGTLTSTNDTGLLNGLNLCVVGNELLQYRTATLVAPSTYDLSGLPRGRRGTEWAMPAHVSGESFVLLPANEVTMSIAEVGQSRFYKAVTSSTTLASAAAIPFTSQGRALTPYSVSSLGGGVDASGNLFTQWIRRDRRGSAWPSTGTGPLSESSEQYVLQVWDSTFTVCARVVTGLTSTAYEYSIADITTDFGAAQANYYISVGQLGAIALGIQTHAVITGTGGSDTSPLNPVLPYASPPTGGGVCTLPTTTSTIDWASPVQVVNSGFSPGTDWVVEFTTPASWGGTTDGHLQGAEYPVDGSGPCIRTSTLSTTPCGPPLTPSCSMAADTVTFPFFTPGNNPLPSLYPTLQTSTTYRVSTTTAEISTMFMTLVHN